MGGIDLLELRLEHAEAFVAECDHLALELRAFFVRLGVAHRLADFAAALEEVLRGGVDHPVTEGLTELLLVAAGEVEGHLAGFFAESLVASLRGFVHRRALGLGRGDGLRRRGYLGRLRSRRRGGHDGLFHLGDVL